jgi:crotonobetainyl-CoA:carnitine CoA-transferase CaiB-like acyl-CoA transferase
MMPGPLAGIKVLDLTSVVSGPLATMFLADQGAEVIKVEPIAGDIARRSRQAISTSGEFSAMFVSTNRGKRSLALDLKRPEAVEIMHRLIARTDVLVQNFRPGTMERLGFGEEALRAKNPRLIYVSISGVGETGPYAKKRVYDPIIQGLSGFADIQSDRKTRRPQMIRTIVADKTTAIFAAQAVCAALYARERSGEGQHIRLAMLDTMISFLWPEAMTQYTVVGREASTADPIARPDLIFETADDYITVGTISDSEWRGFCAARAGLNGLQQDFDKVRSECRETLGEVTVVRAPPRARRQNASPKCPGWQNTPRPRRRSACAPGFPRRLSCLTARLLRRPASFVCGL